MTHAAISRDEAAGRLAIRALVDAYAYRADSRDADGQKAVFATAVSRRFRSMPAGPSPCFWRGAGTRPLAGCVLDRADAGTVASSGWIATFA